MTTSLQGDSFTDNDSSALSPLGVYAAAIALALAASAVTLLLSAIFAIGNSNGDLLVLGGAGVVVGAGGLFMLRRPFSTRNLRPVSTMSAAIVAYLVVASLSTVVYLLTGTLDRVDDALYESVTGVSTSALTIFDDPSTVSEGMLIWRSGTQWLGGLFALALAVGLLPFLGGSRELVGGHQGRLRSSARGLATRPLQAIKRVTIIYSIVTVGVALALVVVGMGFRDGFAHALSTVSTGGFSTRADSIGFFDSPAIEMVLIFAMVGAGSSVALAWMLWRRNLEATRRAFELQVYVAVMILASGWVWWLRSGDGESFWTGAREALFTVVSVMTTTGHRVAEWGSWHPGASTLLLVLLVVGGTAGSAAGGLRWIRVIGMAQFVWRELQRQLHPRSVRTVKVGRAPISEASVDRMHAQMVYVMTLGAVASLVLALFGEGITEAITLTISAISTTGPGFDEAGAIVDAADLSRPERGVLMPVMLTGRVFLYPAFVAVGAGAAAVGRIARQTVGRS